MSWLRGLSLTGVLAFATLPLLLSFQNCGQFNAGQQLEGSFAGSSLSVEPCQANCDSTQNPVVNFNEGDAFSTSLIPYTLKGSIATQVNDYAAMTGYKALALSANGYGAIANRTDYSSQLEANRIALEICQVAAGDQPCAVFAEGNSIRYSQRSFAEHMTKILAKGVRNFDAPSVPFVWDAIRANQVVQYGQSTAAIKVLALGINGSGAWSGGSTVEEATRIAMQRCEAFYRQPCFLYAIGSRVVFNETALTINTTSSLDFTRTTLSANDVPFISNADRVKVSTYIGYMQQGYVGAIALSGNGTWAYFYHPAGASQSATNDEALATCRSYNPNLPCFVYAQSLRVELKPTNFGNN